MSKCFINTILLFILFCFCFFKRSTGGFLVLQIRGSQEPWRRADAPSTATRASPDWQNSSANPNAKWLQEWHREWSSQRTPQRSSQEAAECHTRRAPVCSSRWLPIRQVRPRDSIEIGDPLYLDANVVAYPADWRRPIYLCSEWWRSACDGYTTTPFSSHWSSINWIVTATGGEMRFILTVYSQERIWWGKRKHGCCAPEKRAKIGGNRGHRKVKKCRCFLLLFFYTFLKNKQNQLYVCKKRRLT